MSSSPKIRQGFWFRLGRKFWLPFLGACVLVILLEWGLDHIAENGELPGITQSIFNVSGLYQGVVSATRTPTLRYTAVVEIDPNTDPTMPSLFHICDQREKTATLLRSIAQAWPRVIVVDKYYAPQPNPCAEDADLAQAIRDLREANIPVIIGRHVADEPAEVQGKKHFYLLPSLEFWSPAPCPEGILEQGQGCMQGVTALGKDTRKMPLGWMLYASKEMAQKGEGLSWHDTLAFSAARAYDPKLLQHHPRLAPFIQKGQQPYVSFLSIDDIEPIPASRLLSPEIAPGGIVNLPSRWVSSDLRKLSGKIVLIGEINKRLDSHPTVVGAIPGLYLQANYIEALIDDRYFRPVPVLDYTIGFLFLLILELILTFSTHWWSKMLLIVVLCFSSVGLLYLFIKLLGWYVNPVPLGATAILIKLVHPLFGRAEKSVEVKSMAAG